VALVAKGRCERHQAPKQWQTGLQRRVYDERRGTAHARGYTSRWRRIRNAYLAEHPLCEWCESAGKVTRATEVDHIIALQDGGAIDGSLQSLCHPCHARKTKADDARRAKKRAKF